MKLADLKAMKIGESIQLTETPGRLIRVPNGWIYRECYVLPGEDRPSAGWCCFVPEESPVVPLHVCTEDTSPTEDNIPITFLCRESNGGLPEKAALRLLRYKIKTIGDLTRLTARDLLCMHHVGRKTVRDIQSALLKNGWTLNLQGDMESVLKKLGLE